MKKGGWKELPSKPGTISSYGQNLYFNILLVWIKLLPSFKFLTSMKLPFCINYHHLLQT